MAAKTNEWVRPVAIAGGLSAFAVSGYFLIRYLGDSGDEPPPSNGGNGNGNGNGGPTVQVGSIYANYW